VSLAGTEPRVRGSEALTRYDMTDTGTDTGLSQAEVAARLRSEGYNELPSVRPRSLWAIAGGVVREPMFLLLIACGSAYLLLGDLRDALMLLGFVFVVVTISFLQERKTERALEALRDLSSPRALVIRDGVQRRIPGREVVPGDLLVLAEGDRVPADAVLLTGVSLAVDESLLTGESVAVRKSTTEPVPATMGAPGGDDRPFLYSATLVVQGKGIARTLATGQHTAIGQIGKALGRVAQEPTRIQRETGRIVKRVAWIGALLSLLVALVYGVTRADWLHGLLVGITLAMAILPEELPVVLTIFLGLGAWRIAQKQVLTRNIPALEMLGETTVLCTDKTGTLTRNRMVLERLYVPDRYFDLGAPARPLPEAFHALLEYGRLASHRDPFDPMEQAIRQALEERLRGTGHIHPDWTLVDEYPLSRELLAMSRVWASPDRSNYEIAAKGAPEAILDLCHCDPERLAFLNRQAEQLAAQGLRVLGVARAEFRRTELPAIQHDFDFMFVGFIALADPVRPAVPAAIAESRGAGMRVVMITGDYPATACNIAARIGIESPERYLTGQQLETLGDAQLQQRVREVNVFCRTVPAHKLRLVNAFKANGEIVAMTGDGVNDAPALKAAHIGVAMGGHGTDVARESSDLVLLEDDFSSIVAAVKLGRRIFDNLRKAIAFVIAAHIPIVGMSLIPVLLGWPLVLLPVHILFLQLIIDPACSIVYEAEPAEEDIMRRPPRAPGGSLFDRHTLLLGLLQGGALLLIVLTVYGVTLKRGYGEDVARALTFSTLIIANLGLIFANRSHSRTMLATLGARNHALWWIFGGTLVLLTLVLYVPMLRDLFSFGVLHADDLGIALGAGGISITLFEAVKRFRVSMGSDSIDQTHS